MGERRRGSASDESEMGNAVSGLGQGDNTVEGRPVSETPGAEVSSESEVLRDPSV
jgi:hypothetical protein